MRIGRLASAASLMVIFAAALSGCGAPLKREDPFAGIADLTAVHYKNITVALLLSRNTKNVTAYLQTPQAFIAPRMDSGPVFEEVGGAFAKTFGNVVKISNIQEAASARADLVAVVDVYVKKGMTMSVETRVILMTPAGERLDEVSGAGTRSQLAYVSLSPDPYLRDAAKFAGEELRKALIASTKLAEFSRARGEAAPVAAAPAAARERAFNSDADIPSYKVAENSRNFALVIGIEKYASLPAADHAERDARAVSRHLRALGYPERNIILLTGQQATKTGIEKYVESWFPRNLTEASHLFVYFSGHGAPDPVAGGAYLVPWDGDPKFIEDTGYPIARLYQKLNGLKARQIVVAMDACFSGAGGRSVLAKGARPLVNRVELGDKERGRLVVLAAAAGDEITGTSETQGHGIFTYHLLKGLNERHGDAPVSALYSYLKTRVQDEARRENRDQTPQLLPAPPNAQADIRLR